MSTDLDINLSKGGCCKTQALWQDLPGGIRLPRVGLGTWSLRGKACESAVLSALELGYRLLDTASFYHNEREIGQALAHSEIKRSEIFVTTKLYPDEYGHAAAAIDAALDRLKLDYVDMLMLHHPAGNDVQAWSAVEQAVKSGKARVGGISCYYERELSTFLPKVRLQPVLVQNEIHPFYQDRETVRFIQSKGLVVQSWYPLGGRGHTRRLLEHPVITAIAGAHQVTAAQVILRWDLQHGVCVIPGSADPEHQAQNLQLFHFALSENEMDQIDALERREKHDWY